MIARSLARLFVTLAMLCASVAWTGWVVLHTIADPTRSSKIAHAVLDDPEARDQVAGDLTNGLADAVNAATGTAAVGTGVKVPKIDGDNPTLRRAVADALGDPRVATNIIDALAAGHANALGVEPKRPAVIDTALLVDVVAKGVGTADADLANRLTSAAPKSIEIPDIEIPLAARIRRFATTWVPRLGIFALVLAGAALAIGDRARVLRRAGGWALGAGLSWAVAPRVIVWLAERFAPGNAAVVRAVLEGAAGVVTAAATTLALVGAALVVGSFFLDRLPVGRPFGANAHTAPDGDRATVRGRPRHWTRPGRRDEPLSPGWRTFTGRDLPRSEPQRHGSRFDSRG